MICPYPRAVSIWRIWEFTNAGAEPGLLKPGLCSESLHNPATASSQSLLCTWHFVCIFWSHASMIFSPLHLTASQLRPVLPGSDGTLGAHFAHPKGSFTCPFPPGQPGQCRVQLNSQDCVKYKINRLECWHQLSHSNVSWPPGKVGTEEVNNQC